MRLIVSDLDGTLYPKKSDTSETTYQKNIEAIQKWTSQGNLFAVATARGIFHYPELKENLGFDMIYIGANGAETRIDENKVILKTIPSSIFIDIARYLLQENINASVATGVDGKWSWSSIDRYPVDTRDVFKAMKEYMHVAKLDEIDPNYQVPRIQIYVPKEDKEALMNELNRRLKNVWITSSDDDLIDIGPVNSSKGISILEMAAYFGVPNEDVITIGDSQNDIAMFEICQNSYCIDHADAIVKRHATYIIPSVWEMIEKELNHQ
ncbi:MAG: HAD-IIB family hydrolase [Erysipelotrichaceae bacterium]